MAEEIKLVGVFRDEITPKLKKLNKEINQVTKSFSKMGRKLKPLAADFKKLGDAVEKVGNGLNKQNMELGEAARAMSKYRTQVRRTASEQKKLKPMRGGARGGGGGGRGGMGGGRGMGVGSIIGGNIIGSVVTDAIYRGFEMGVQLMMKPFQMLGAAIADGIADEMSDIQSSGGMFALDKKSKVEDRIFGNFIQARNFQEELNRELAMSAASLPGATSDYVQSAKQLTDTVFGTFGKSKEAFAGLAQGLGAKEGSTDKENITKVLTKFTEQSVLLSQGSKGGMPLGMLLEQLISQDNVSIKTYKKRYKQLRSNPLLAGMLEDAEAEINASGSMTADRFKAVMGALDNALPQEVVNSMRRSVSGVAESIRSGLFDQEVGLLGLRRPLEKSIAAINEFGQYIDEEGKVVQTAAEAAREQTTIFKMFRDIIAGFGLPLSEIIGILPEVFDPLNGMADALEGMRAASIAFAQNANKYTNFFKQEGFDKAGARGSLAAVNKLLSDMGALGEGDAMANAKKLESKDFNPASMVMGMMKSLLNSDFMGEIGQMIGGVVGSVFKVIDQMINGVVDTMEGEGGNKFMEGLSEGFKSAFGEGSMGKTLSKAFAYVAKILAKAFVNHVLPAIVDSIVGVITGAWESGPGGQLIVITAGLIAFATAFSIISSLWGALVLVSKGLMFAFGALKGILAIVGPALSMFGSILKFIVAGSLGTLATTLAAIVGAITGVIAIFRHLDFIASSTVESLNILGQMFMWASGAVQSAVGALVQGIGYAVQAITFGAKGAGMIEQGTSMRTQGGAMRDAAAASMGNSMTIIGQNTAASFARTAEDFTDIGNKMGLASDKQLEAARAQSQKMYAETILGRGAAAAAAASPSGATVPSGITGISAPAPDPAQQTLLQNLGGLSVPLKAAEAATKEVSAKQTSTNAKIAEGVVKQEATNQAIAASSASTSAGLYALLAGPLNVKINNMPNFAAASGMPALGFTGAKHSANALGSKNPAFFQTQAGAEAWERKMAPKNAAISSMTANSSEFGGGHNITNNINVTGGSASETAEEVAQQIVYAIQKSTYNELYTS